MPLNLFAVMMQAMSEAVQDAKIAAQPSDAARWKRSFLAATATFLLIGGLLLRIYFLRRHAFLAADSLLYQDIALNWLHGHVYGLSEGSAPRPTLIRLPGYPFLLAVLEWAFGRWFPAGPGTLRSFLPVLILQVIADLATCCLAAATARRLFGERGFVIALAIGCLCPFTANYTAVPLTETFTLFFLALTFRLLQLCLDRPARLRLVALSAAIAAGIYLRPDQGLLAAAVVPALVFAHVENLRRRWMPPLFCTAVIVLALLPWTLRNLRTFHVFQPLAPRLAVDPGEPAPIGFYHWFRTWAVDFSATEDAYWKYPEEPVLISDLPSRAFDSAGQRALTADLLQQAADTHGADTWTEQGLNALARRRARAHPLRTFVVLPVARLANMLLHPRTEMLPIAERWWQYRLHPAQTLFAWFYAALNLAYLAAGAAGGRAASRANRVLALSMLAYFVFRCALLLTLDNAEQRYTLEFFPILFVWASAPFARRAAVST